MYRADIKGGTVEIKKKRTSKKGKDRKPHTFKGKKNSNGLNDTKPVQYNEETVLKHAKAMLKQLRDDKQVGGSYTIFHKLQLFTDTPFSYNYFCDLVNKYGDNKKISETVLRVDEILKGRVWLGGLTGVLNSSIVRFNLIANHGERELERVEVSGRIENTLLIRSIIKRSKEKK